MVREIRPTIVFIVAPALISGVAYPFVITAIARVVFPDRAQGSLLERDGQVVGSVLIGQGFTSKGYFHARPSAVTFERLGGAIAELRQENPWAQVPGDLMTTSASGLDPQISREAALFQVPRVAKAGNLPENRVRQLVAENATDPRAARQRARTQPGSRPHRRSLGVSIAASLFSATAGPILVSMSCCSSLPWRACDDDRDNPRSKRGDGMITTRHRSRWIGRPNDDGSRKRTMYYIVIEKCSSSFGTCARVDADGESATQI